MRCVGVSWGILVALPSGVISLYFLIPFWPHHSYYNFCYVDIIDDILQQHLTSTDTASQQLQFE